MTKKSNSHALIHFPKAPTRQGNFGCGIFADFQKAFDKGDHDILIQKLHYYGVRDTANNCFSSYLEIRTQFVSINGFSSDLHFACYGLPHRLYPIDSVKYSGIKIDENLTWNHQINNVAANCQCLCCVSLFKLAFASLG